MSGQKESFPKTFGPGVRVRHVSGSPKGIVINVNEVRRLGRARTDVTVEWESGAQTVINASRIERIGGAS